ACARQRHLAPGTRPVGATRAVQAGTQERVVLGGEAASFPYPFDHRRLLGRRDSDSIRAVRVPVATQPRVHVHARDTVDGGGEFALERGTSLLPVSDHRTRRLALQLDHLTNGGVLGPLQLAVAALTGRVCSPGGQ